MLRGCEGGLSNSGTEEEASGSTGRVVLIRSEGMQHLFEKVVSHARGTKRRWAGGIDRLSRVAGSVGAGERVGSGDSGEEASESCGGCG